MTTYVLMYLTDDFEPKIYGVTSKKVVAETWSTKGWGYWTESAPNYSSVKELKEFKEK